MTSKVFFRQFESYLKDNGIELKYTHNGQVLGADDYEDLYKLTYQYALTQSLLLEQTILMSRFSKMEYDTVTLTQHGQKKLLDVRKRMTGLIKPDEKQVMDELNDNKIVEVIEGD